jgi:hypothetical protein
VNLNGSWVFLDSRIMKKRGSSRKNAVKNLFLRYESFILGENGSYSFCGYGPPDKGRKFTTIVDMGQLETDNKSEAEAGDADKGITDDVNHANPPLGLPREFINDRNHGISIRTLFCYYHKPPGIIHNQELVSEDHPNGKGDDPDPNVNQKIGE